MESFISADAFSVLATGGPGLFTLTTTRFDMTDFPPFFGAVTDQKQAFSYVAKVLREEAAKASPNDITRDYLERATRIQNYSFTANLGNFSAGNVSIEKCRALTVRDFPSMEDFERMSEEMEDGTFNGGDLRNFFYAFDVNAQIKEIDGVKAISAEVGGRGYIINFLSCLLKVSDDALMKHPTSESNNTFSMGNKTVKDFGVGAVYMNNPGCFGAKLVGDGLDRVEHGLSLTMQALKNVDFSSLAISLENGFFALGSAGSNSIDVVNESHACTVSLSPKKEETDEEGDEGTPTPVKPVEHDVNLQVNGMVAGDTKLTFTMPALVINLDDSLTLTCKGLKFRQFGNAPAAAHIEFKKGTVTTAQAYAAVEMRNSATMYGLAMSIALVASALAYFF